MKSYQNHLSTTKHFGESIDVNYRPTMRSSAVFPLLHRVNKLSSVYTFMGYWLKKRNIPLVTVLFTVRDAEGEKVKVESIEVRSIKSYSINSSDLIPNKDKNFAGSVEIEIFSAVDMVFPYPAITFALKGQNGLTFVHTCGRIYNDFEDLKSNEEQTVPETGFDILVGKSYEPFFAFVNGPIPINNKEIELEYINTVGSRIVKKRIVKDVKPYGLAWINLDKEDDLDWDDCSSKLCVKIRHNFEGFFPRFVAGNVYHDYEDVSVTHSYYDTSVDKSKGAYWENNTPDKFFDSVFAVPFDSSFSEIELAIYPNFAPHPTNMTLELYSSDGELLDEFEHEKQIASNDTGLTYVKLLKRFSKNNAFMNQGMIRAVLNGNGVVPSRMKFGLNFINNKLNYNLPSNICFAANVPNSKVLDKPSTFRWCTVFNVENQKIFLHNTSFVKDGFKDAEVNIELCREIDDKKINWSIVVPYNGTVEILSPVVKNIIDFLGKDIGWISFFCNSPFISGYYITDYGKGVVGADHLY